MSPLPLIDSHAHIAEAEFDGDRAELLERARAAGVQQIIVVGAGGDLATAERAIALAESDPDLFAVVGIHPHDAIKLDPGWWPRLRELASRDVVVAVGETGLDYYYDNSPPNSQRQAFGDFLELARTVAKPVVCHIRDAHDDARAILAEHALSSPVLIHCFTGTPDDASSYIELGCHISFSGVVTFRGRKSDPLREAIRRVPLDRLLLETDCPYLAPAPNRGKRNEPAYVTFTAEVVAREAGVDLTTLATATVANTQAFFSLT